MRARWPRLVPLCFALLAGAAAGRAEEPAAPPHLPSGTTPLPAESAKHLDELLHVVETYSGLKALRSVPAGSTSPQKLKEHIKALMLKNLPPEAREALGTSLKAFGLIPESMSLERYLPELLSSQVAGFYDPDGKYVAVVDLPRGAAGEEAKTEGDMVLTHELTHALQDQHFDLHRFEDPDPLSDGGAAKTALVEGDATLAMIDAGMRASFEAMPGADKVLAGMMQDPEKLIADSPHWPGAKEMSAAPAWIRDTLTFSYFQGLAFCVSARRRGGQALLDYAFTTDPPRSTEQILHPEKWHTRRDDPIVLHFPDLAAELPGYRKAAEGEMGELGLQILFRQNLKSREQADAAAAGWGGDRFAVYEKDGGRLIAWITEWDSEADAGEFRSALQAVTGWRAEAAGPTRVLAVRGSLPDEAWAKVRARLAAVPAERPANREIDLKAIGAAPIPLDQAEAEKIKAAHEAAQGTAALAGEVSPDGRIYTNPMVGFSLRLPKPLAGWSLNPRPASKNFLMEAVSPGSAVRVVVIIEDLPKLPSSPVPLSGDALAGGLVESLRGVLPGFTVLRREAVDKGGIHFQDFWYEARIKEKPMRGVLRYASRGSRAYCLLALGRTEPWEKRQAEALAVLDTFTFLAP